MQPQDNPLAVKLWEIYGARWPLPMHSATLAHVWHEFNRRGYKTEEDIPKFMVGVAYDEWYAAEHRGVGDWPEGWRPVEHKYLNFYVTDQAYGGPEEGGWYYEVGEPKASLPVPIDTLQDEIDKVYHNLCNILGFLMGRPGHSFVVESDYAYPYPEKQPHYE